MAESRVVDDLEDVTESDDRTMAEALLSLQRLKTPSNRASADDDMDLGNDGQYPIASQSATMSSRSPVVHPLGFPTLSPTIFRPSSNVSSSYRWPAPGVSTAGLFTRPRGMMTYMSSVVNSSAGNANTHYTFPSTPSRVRTSFAASEPRLSVSQDTSAHLEERLTRMEDMLKQMQFVKPPEPIVTPVSAVVTSNAYIRNDAVLSPAVQQSVAQADTPASTRRPGEGHNIATVQVKSGTPHVKLGVYRGDTSLETFLAKFENCSKYLNWNESDRFFHLSNALDGTAGDVLWNAATCDSVDELIQLLRNRFGNQNQTERFRAELKSRRRRAGESLQKLYQDICRLMALAYPGPSNAMSDSVAVEAFLDALDDKRLRREIRIQKPKNLDAALEIACHLEACETDDEDRHEAEGSNHRGRKNRYVRTTKAADNDASRENAQLSKRVDALQGTLNDVLAKLNSMDRPSDHQSSSVSGTVAAPASSMATSRPMNQSTGRIDRNTCKSCFQKGHWAKFCPQAKARPNDGQTGGQRPLGSQTNVITGKALKLNAVYVKARINRRLVTCLLDSGCEQTVINSKLVSHLEVEPTEQRLFAADKSELPVKGCVKLRLNVHGIPTSVTALVTDVVEDVILGIDWLVSHDVHWDFQSSAINLKGKKILLLSRESQNLVRRVYVCEPITIPAGHVTDVPVSVTLRDLRIPKSQWATEPRVLKKTVVVARTLVDEVKAQSAIPVANLGNTPCHLSEGQFIGNAVQVHVGDSETCVQQPQTTDQTATNGVPEHVQCLISTLPPDLSFEEYKAVKAFVAENADLFSKSDYDIGRTQLVKHRIDTGDHPPFKEPLRHHPMAFLPVIDQHVNEMLAHDIIEPAASPWASNVVLIRKKDGAMRFCVDYRRLNTLTRKDSYPLPRIEDCLSSLGGACYFSTLDLRAGYWQTEMDERDSDKTAFVTRRGIFKFKVLSFGLANAPALFQRLMDHVLAGLTWEACLVYLDDIIVWANSFEEELRRLSQVFQRLRDANLKLKSSKCRLFQRKTLFLGHVISANGVEPDPDKIRSIVEWPVPRNLTEVRSFLGLASYYRRHVRGFADIARPMHELQRKKEPFEWTQRRQDSFDRLKHCLVTAPVLAAPRDEGLYILDTDASDIGLGAVLQQEQPDGLRVIAYASCAMSRAEVSYCTTRKELLAIIYGLKKFRQYLLAREFVIRTDHAALTYLLKTPEPVGQQARWLDLLGEYNFTIQHRSGDQNRNADALSRRRPCERGSEESVCKCRSKIGDDRLPESAASGESRENVDSVVYLRATSVIPLADASLFTADALKEAQAADETLLPIIKWRTENVERPEWKLLETESEETRTLWAQYESLKLIDGVLYRSFYNTDGTESHLQLVVPRSLRGDFLKLVHEGAGGHFANRKTQDQVQRRAYWPGWRTSVRQFINRCLPCSQYQAGKPKRQGALQCFEANGPADRYCIDLVGPHPRTKRGKKYILTAVDAYTRHLTCVALPDKSAHTVARALVEEVFYKLACPRTLISDLGTEFQNQVLGGICSILGITKLRTTVHRPNANGRCERTHKNISACLAKLVASNQTDWDEHLPLVTFAINCAKSEATGYAAFELMYGRLPRMPIEMVLDVPDDACPESVDQYVEDFRERARKANVLVQQHMKTSFARMKKNYDAKVRDTEFSVGQFVLFYYPRRYRGRNPKLSRPNIGPFRVLQRLNAVNYIIALTPRSRKMIVHVDKLKAWHGDIPKCWEGVNVPTEPAASEARTSEIAVQDVASDNSDDANAPTSGRDTVMNAVETADCGVQTDAPAKSVTDIPERAAVASDENGTSASSRATVPSDVMRVLGQVRHPSKIPTSKHLTRVNGKTVLNREHTLPRRETDSEKLEERTDSRPARNIRPPARYRD